MLPNKKLITFISLATLGIAGCHSAQDPHNKSQPVVIAYQTGVDPSKAVQAEGVYDKEIGHPVSWKRFNSGAEVINALASGSVDIADLGSSPLATAATRQLPIQTFLIASQIEGAEALVVRNQSNIQQPKDLIGKKIATPFVSTSHYSLLGALKHWNIAPTDVKLINLNPSEINAAWQRGDIDAAFVWSPALAEIKKTGHVLTDAKEVGTWGAPTFEVWVVRNDFAKDNPDVVKAFADVTLKSYADYRQQKQNWTANSKPVKEIAQLTGVKPEDIPTLLTGANFPIRTEQLSPTLLGGGTVKAISKTADFLKQQGLVGQALSDYSPYVSTKFVSKQ